MTRYAYRRMAYETPPEVAGRPGRRRPVIVVGAGPVGLSMAIDLARRDIDILLLDDNDRVSVGSRAICWAKRTLEIFDRLGVGQRMLDKGVTWKVGRLFHGEEEVYAFDLLPEDGHRMPAFVNLQQYYVEEYLIDRARELSGRLEMRWKNRVSGVEPGAEGVRVHVDTPDGGYALDCDWLVACDGARSPVRGMLGLDFAGRVFEEKFLIADVEMAAGDMPSERWFWFDPPFHAGDSALVHKQPDDIYRIDLQLGPEADPEEEARPEKVIPRIRAAVGERDFELDWVSVYTFQCRRLERFVHGRVLFAGDSAHLVSPFGARGGNGGIQDIDNLGWKLAAVIQGRAPARLIDTYDEERVRGADENIRESSRSTGFMTPKSAVERDYREAVLDLAADLPFARRLVNSGRLSVPCSLDGLSLQTPDDGRVDGPMAPGAPCLDAPVTTADGEASWLLHHLGDDGFTLMVFAGADGPPAHAAATTTDRHPLIRPLWILEAPGDAHGQPAVVDADGLVAARYGGAPGVTYLIRPDQHVAARWPAPEAEAVTAALARALAGATEAVPA
ncbi:MAG: FAD-dependent oxidoreductase [Azospirillaceae bacterium]